LHVVSPELGCSAYPAGAGCAARRKGGIQARPSENRASGSLARQWRTTASRSAGTSGRRRDNGSGASYRCAAINFMLVRPAKGGSPVRYVAWARDGRTPESSRAANGAGFNILLGRRERADQPDFLLLAPLDSLLSLSK